MTLQPQERSQAQTNVVTPRAPRAHLRPLDQTVLLDAAVIALYCPREARPLNSLKVIHLDSVRRPHFNVAVRGDDLEDADKTEAFEPDDSPALPDLDFADGPQPRAVGVHFAVALQACQPRPAERANQLQVIQPRVPAIEGHAGRSKAPQMSLLEHRLEVVVLRQSVPLLVEDAVIDGDVAVAVGPQQSNQVDAAHHGVVLARPVARDEFHLAGVGLVQGRVVYDKYSLAQADLRLSFAPQGRGVRLKAVEQAGEGIVGWRLLLIALQLRRLGRAHSARRGDHEVDVVVVRALGRVHALFLLHFLSTA